MKPHIIDLVRAMATDPQSPESLRAFHRQQLAGLEERAARVEREPRQSPFSRFIDKLETPENTAP